MEHEHGDFRATWHPASSRPGRRPRARIVRKAGALGLQDLLSEFQQGALKSAVGTTRGLQNAVLPEAVSEAAQVEALQAAMTAMARRMQELEGRLRELERFKPVELREAGANEVKGLVLEYYRTHGDTELYPSDVAAALGLDLWAVHEATEELVVEGKLA